MKVIALTARSLVSILGLALIVLGVLFWTGRALGLLPLQMLLGVLFVVCLWILVVLALVARTARGLALFTLAWSLIVPVFGLTQLKLLPGPAHWLVQTIHLAVGLIAMGLAHALARAILELVAVTRPSPEPV